MNKFTLSVILLNSLFVSIETAHAKSLINNYNNANIEIERKTANVDEIYQNLLVDVVADAARQVLRSKQDRPNLAIANITGNVRMSVPGHPDNLLTAEGVHSFLTSEIKKELERMF